MLYGPTETAYIVMYGNNDYLSESESWICMEEIDAQELVLSLWEEYLYEQYGYNTFCFNYAQHKYEYDWIIHCVEVPLY